MIFLGPSGIIGLKEIPYLTDSGRKTFLSHWQERKKVELTHPYLEEKIPWGLVPYIQALLSIGRSPQGERGLKWPEDQG